MIDEQRAKLETQAIAKLCETVNYDFNEGWVELEPIPLPDGWNRETTTVRVERLDRYPACPPTILLPDDLQFDGESPRRMIQSPTDGWARYLLGFLGPGTYFGYGSDPTFWDPHRHTVITMLRRFEQTLRNPNQELPFK